MTTPKRSRKFFITSFIEVIPEEIEGYQYILVAKEHCPTTQKVHWHIYIEFVNQQTFTKLRGMFPGANIAEAKGTAKHNKEYLSKENLVFEKGIPKQQGKRNDLHQAMKDVEEGISELELYRNHASVVARYGSFLKEYRNLTEPQRDWETECIVLHGPTGTGKTRTAIEDGAVRVSYVNGFINGYNGQDVVLFDEFDWTTMPRSLFLELTDRYPMQVNVKGGVRNWKPRKIYFCSNDDHPDQMWYKGDSAMLRRLKFVKMEASQK